MAIDVSGGASFSDEEQMLLVRRGFHWINELPHNR